MIKVNWKQLQHFDVGLGLPSYGTPQSCGLDIKVCFPDRDSILLRPNQKICLPTGLAVELPPDFELQVRPRSSTALKRSILILNSPGTIDADYRGEIKIIVGLYGNKPEIIRHGDKLAQLVLAPTFRMEVMCVDNLSDTLRGSNGFGHTGN